MPFRTESKDICPFFKENKYHFFFFFFEVVPLESDQIPAVKSESMQNSPLFNVSLKASDSTRLDLKCIHPFR